MERNRPNPCVLDVGCACGANFLRLREEMPDAAFYGIELNPHSAAIARRFGKVLSLDVETLEMAEWADKFDAVIMGDVLEHLRDP